MDQAFKEFAQEAESWFAGEDDFSDDSTIHEAALKVYSALDEYRLGPAALSLLVVFAFPVEVRAKIWQEIQKVIQENRGEGEFKAPQA